MVFAEANAVGTPVLTYNVGAASEVLNGSFQLVEPGNEQAFLDKLMEWHQNRPQVSAKEEFRLKNIIKKWEEFLYGNKEQDQLVN